MSLVDYIAATKLPLPPIRAQMYEYVTARNGVFVRGQRHGLHVMLPVAIATRGIAGLEPVKPYVYLGSPRVPQEMVSEILQRSLLAQDASGEPVEILFHLSCDNDQWRLDIPPQVQGRASVRPAQDAPSLATAIVEVHSHHDMHALFSPMDDEDEADFRIYAVLGAIHSQPLLRVRAGLYGHRWEIPASVIFNMPPDVWGVIGEP